MLTMDSCPGIKQSSEVIQQSIVRRLDDIYADSVLDGADSLQKRVKTKKSLRQRDADSTEERHTNAVQRSQRRKEKKKNRKKKLKMAAALQVQEDSIRIGVSSLPKLRTANGKKPVTGKRKILLDIKSELGLDDKARVNVSKPKQLPPTNEDGKRQPEVIIFEDHRNKNKKQKNKRVTTAPSNDTPKHSGGEAEQQGALSLREARHDVFRFGITGFERRKKEEARVELLVKLGAKRPKNKCINYPEYMEMKRREKEAAKQEMELQRTQGYSVKKQPAAKRKRDKDDVLRSLDAPVGKYRGGMLSLSRDEINNIKKSKLKHM
ncbi:PREDICTED: uncharacterized protein C1orf131 homolog isoform X2 [Priapulus caudatus]|uniref:Uncharacterized protein C1orf131 homolog isoform X2 n=1 Tax=Priapulus caudatus TaxID=37621 RepID=A0ABM1DU65_PRICU|nr:PREDICTED: uncharacterized protein C1orf131 homolog isoform X2 [Priapulus caudatus]